MITRIDHVAVSVHDFPAALARYTSLLGQAACAQEGEPGRRAALFALCNTYVLLLEAAAPDAAGISALGLAAADADSCVASLHAQGIALTALPEHPAGLDVRAGARAQLWELGREHTHGLPLRIVDRPVAPLPAADSFRGGQVEALDHVVIRSAAMDQAQALYGGTLGVRLALDRELAGTRMLFFRTGGVTIEVIADAADAFYGLAYRVRDLEAAHLRLTAAGFALTAPRPGRKPGTQVFSTRSALSWPAAEGGVPTLFIRDASRD